jgi:nucleotide-binding universal stress UspA family protein
VALKVQQNVSADTLALADAVYAVSKGELGEKIKEYCMNNAIDLIIISHKHHGKLYSSFFDTPDENIIDSVNVPVLIFPKK